MNDIVRRQQDRESLQTSRKAGRVSNVSLEESEILKELNAHRVEVNEIEKKQG